MYMQLKRLNLICLWFLSSLSAFAQFTTTTATITDSDSTVWTNAQVTVSFQPNPNQPNLNSYNINGIPLQSLTYNSYLQQTGTTNGSGALSFVLLDNQLITPAGSSWHFVVKPNAGVQAISYNPIAVTGGSFNLTSYLSSNSIAPRLPALPGSYAYADLEIQPIPNVGGFYFNTTATIQRIWNGTGWQNGAGGGGTIPSTNNVLKGSGTTGIAVPATAGTDYVIPAGNVATATALAALPSKCSAGQAPLGVDAQGNALTCQTIGAGGAIPSTLFLLKGTGTIGISEPASPGNDYIYPYTPNGMNPSGPAVIGTNQDSNLFWWQGSVCTASSPCTPQSFFYSAHAHADAGINPSTLLSFQYSGPGTSLASFDYPLEVPTAVTGDKSTLVATTQNVFNNLPSLPAQFFGAYGDAYQPPDGCQPVASNTTMVCNDNPFVSTAVDGGKDIWVSGKGTAGAAFHATILTVIDNSTVTMSAAPVASGSNIRGVFGHDDTVAVQACNQYSATNSVSCVLKAIPNPGLGLTGFLIGSTGLQLVSSNADEESSATNITGSSSGSGTNLFCEANGDCLGMGVGPIPNAVVSNISLLGDPTQPNGRGFHFLAQPGTFGNGGLWFSNFTNVQVTNFNLECMLSEGGNYLSSGLLPNQVNTFINFNCNAPNQMHTANLIKMTGQHAQITFINGQVNGPGSTKSNQPNAMVLITEQTTGQGDSATDTKFFGYTIEVGTIGLQLGSGALNIHYDNSYIEAVDSPVIAGGTDGVYGFTFNGNHIANSGDGTAVAQFTGNVTGSFHDALIYGSSPAATAIAVCTGTGNSIDFSNDYTQPTRTTTNCATTTASPSTSTLTVTGGSSVNVGADSTAITTISAPVINSGKTLTLIATGIFSLTTGGNINLGGYGSSLSVPVGATVTLTLLDQGTTWTVTGTTGISTAIACAPPVMKYRWISAAACSTSQPCATDQVIGNNASQITGGDLPTYNPTSGPSDGASFTFNGTTDFLLPTTPIAAPTDLTVYAVFKTATTPTSHGYPFIGGAANGIEFEVGTGNQISLNQQDVAGVAGIRTFTPGTWYGEVATYKNSTTTISFYAVSNGALLPDGGGVQAFSFSATTPDLGANTHDNEFFNGPIAEVGYLDSVNTAGIANWLSCHYGIQ